MNLATVNEYVQEIVRLHAEIARLRLTGAEREAITDAADAYSLDDDDPGCEHIAATLRGLLERTKWLR